MLFNVLRGFTLHFHFCSRSPVVLLTVAWTQVEAFWVCYCHLARPSALPTPTDLHLFKEGIRPLWEVRTLWVELVCRHVHLVLNEPISEGL